MANAFHGIAADPCSERAGRLQRIAASVFLVAAGLLLAAGITWRPGQQGVVADVLGWAGAALLLVFTLVGEQCHRENQRETQREE
jgi:hypothetical protein